MGGMNTITKALQDISTLTVFNISNNSVGDKAADGISTVLSHNVKLQKLYLDNNNFRTVGMIKIGTALQNVFKLTVFSISKNDVGEAAADTIAAVLSHS